MPLRWNLIDSESFRELIARRLHGLILPRNRAGRTFLFRGAFGVRTRPRVAFPHFQYIYANTR